MRRDLLWMVGEKAGGTPAGLSEGEDQTFIRKGRGGARRMGNVLV